MPIATHGSFRDFALKRNDDLREKVGWNDMVARVVAIRDALPAEKQVNLGIVVGNYGEQGAIARPEARRGRRVHFQSYPLPPWDKV